MSGEITIEERIALLRDHIERHKNRERATFSIAGLSVVLDEIEQLRSEGIAVIEDAIKWMDLAEEDLQRDASKSLARANALLARMKGGAA